MLEATSQATLVRIVDKLESLVDKIHALEKTLTQDMTLLKDNLNSEFKAQDSRIDKLEIELAQMRVVIGILGAIALTCLGGIGSIVVPNMFRVHPAKAEMTIVK